MYFNHAARRNNFCLKENKKLQNMLHIHPIWMTTIAHSVKKKKQNRNQENYMMLSFWQEKKIENETEKKTLLQLTTYVMCHKNEQWF